MLVPVDTSFDDALPSVLSGVFPDALMLGEEHLKTRKHYRVSGVLRFVRAVAVFIHQVWVRDLRVTGIGEVEGHSQGWTD